MHYAPFNYFLLRTPLFPVKYSYDSIIEDPIFKEALYLASPEFYKQVSIAKPPYSLKIQNTLYKYYARITTRSTPFGLFASCSSGNISDTTKLVIADSTKICRKTRLDMSYISALIHHIERIPEVRNQILFYLNDSIYKIGNKLRYVEYVYTSGKRTHHIQEIESSKYISVIIKKAQNGAKISDLINLLCKMQIEEGEAKLFVHSLIDIQFLQSDLQLSMIDDDVLTHLIRKISLLDKCEDLVKFLKGILNLLKEIDNNLYHSDNIYSKLFNHLSSINVSYEQKYLIQTDTYNKSSLELDSDIIKKDLGDVLDYLLRISSLRLNYTDDLSEFVKEFSNRYEGQEIPLMHVLDPDCGIGYPVNMRNTRINPLIYDLIKNFNENRFPNISLSFMEQIILHKMFLNRSEGNKSYIELLDTDIPKCDIQSFDIPATTSIMFQLMKDVSLDKYSFYIKSCGNICGAALLGRFCYLDKSIFQMAKNICDYEKKYYKKNILAEINHLPEAHTGNVILRPFLRDYEIHYLANPYSSGEDGIPVSDLFIRMKKRRLILYSQKYKHEIIPRLTNAHNFKLSNQPVYRFLCDYQRYNTITPTLFSVDNILHLLSYVPRIVYKNSILHLETWLVKSSDFEEFGNIQDNLAHIVNKWREIRNIPKEIIIKNFDNELYIDFTKQMCINVFFKELKKNKEIVIQEFIYSDNSSLITDGVNKYNGEFIIPFQKNF